ncbi:hypothetical protein ASPWEDRAFT_40750 [Aspergillus wentii DTO 134E9]|uniref:Uncharacterized protein n=1 Tax=Aspergillus wentii DTO 134E9 TaxID=1073089 RepID=A0A1L9RKZ6_ASPWE|nr:uncharacterized protein ASPWEDRAFT_40750 [Aspergillus wentii DTO 134E9]KAI9924680.1 hypothetical protein MW887_006955 [Aspergillus wentii]OJJ35553.1 hypothetical protein ASPWEDRAFT_40750 [Aspergillus wentii DTO 134E9]
MTQVELIRHHVILSKPEILDDIINKIYAGGGNVVEVDQGPPLLIVANLHFDLAEHLSYIPGVESVEAVE